MFLILLFGIVGCQNNIKEEPGSVDITSVIKASFKDNVTVITDSNKIIIKSNGLPDHKTPYWEIKLWQL